MSNLEPGQLQRTECGAIDGALESLFGILRTGFALLALAVQHILLTGFADRDVFGANAFVAALDPRQHRRHGCLVVMAGRLLAECMVDLLSGFLIAQSCHPAAATQSFFDIFCMALSPCAWGSIILNNLVHLLGVRTNEYLHTGAITMPCLDLPPAFGGA